MNSLTVGGRRGMSAIAWHLDNATRVTYILHSKTGIINRCSTSLDRAPEHREKIVYRAISTTTSTAKTDEPTGRLRRPSGAQAILQGAKDRYEKTGKALILIHTPGTAPMSSTRTSIFLFLRPSSQVIAADNEGYVKTYIVLSPTIYGVPAVKLVEASLARKQGGVVGEGKSYWPNVDWPTVLDHLQISPSRRLLHLPNSGICFTVSNEHQSYDVFKAVAVGLARQGIGSPEPTPFSKTEAEPLLYALSTNSRTDFEMLTLFSSVEVTRLCPNGGLSTGQDALPMTQTPTFPILRLHGKRRANVPLDVSEMIEVSDILAVSAYRRLALFYIMRCI
ncbi:hypothetical protein EV421DRAFT_1901741 [Armillaria borealis]|uniref:Uncharacterized protein n=1 Tax=Armillaria borealis TaxID=47425 RepID=A0AA39JS96_9AGAR|nr:hypothetical protein EV421DRAFT_1901741 [Armillaria borealis]